MSNYDYFKQKEPDSIKGSIVFDRVYKSIGKQLDKLLNDKDDLVLQLNPQTCTWGIDMWEDMCGIEHSSQPLDIRRTNVIGKLSQISPITRKRLETMLQCYVEGELKVINNVAPYTFEISITGGSLPDGLNGLYDKVEEVKPCHLAVRYDLISLISSNIYYAAASIAGETITVYPWTPKEIESRGKINLATASANNTETISVYPKEG